MGPKLDVLITSTVDGQSHTPTSLKHTKKIQRPYSDKPLHGACDTTAVRCWMSNIRENDPSSNYWVSMQLEAAETMLLPWDGSAVIRCPCVFFLPQITSSRWGGVLAENTVVYSCLLIWPLAEQWDGWIHERLQPVIPTGSQGTLTHIYTHTHTQKTNHRGLHGFC